jgi:nitrate reductase NapD
MPDDGTAMLHVSSAVVMTWPEHCAEVARRIAAMPDTEVVFAAGSRIVLVMEGPNTGVIGARLAEIALFDGVLAANLVFEHADVVVDAGDGTCPRGVRC